MNNLHYKLSIIIGLTFVLCAGNVFAENGVIVESVQKSFSDAVFHAMYADSEIWDNPELRKKTILNVDVKKLEAKAKEIQEPPDVNTFTFYMQGDMFRMDNVSPLSDKMTMIFRKDLGMMYQINWPTKQVMKISIKELEQMRNSAQEQIKKMQKQMPPEMNMDNMLSLLPPEQQDAIRKAMNEQGNQASGQPAKKKKPELSQTGKSKDINDFSDCLEYYFDEGNEAVSIWAYKGKPNIAKIFHEASKKFKESFGGMENDDIDPEELLPDDQFPVLTVTYSEDMMRGNMNLDTTEVVSVKESNIDKKLFEAYNDPTLTESTMMDMMNIR